MSNLDINLVPTFVIDSDARSIQYKAETLVNNLNNTADCAVCLFYEIMPEYPVLCTGMNGILIIPFPLEGSTHIPLPQWEGLGEGDRGTRRNFHPHLNPPPSRGRR